MTVKFTLNYTDGDFIETIEVPIYKAYRKGTSFQLYHLNRTLLVLNTRNCWLSMNRGLPQSVCLKVLQNFVKKLSLIY